MPDDLVIADQLTVVPDAVNEMTKKDRDAGISATVQWEYMNIMVDAARMASELNRFGRLGWEGWGIIEAQVGASGKPMLGVALKRRKDLLVMAKTIT